MPVRTLIVDNEDLSRERVRSLLARDERVEVVGECANGVDALHVIEKEAPDLVFLDIEMPEQSGLEMLEAIAPERYPQIVFVTAYDEYWQRAFEVHALDYLRKPFTDERFYDALAHACRRVEERLGHVRTRESVLAMLAHLRQGSSDGQDTRQGARRLPHRPHEGHRVDRGQTGCRVYSRGKGNASLATDARGDRSQPRSGSLPTRSSVAHREPLSNPEGGMAVERRIRDHPDVRPPHRDGTQLSPCH